MLVSRKSQYAIRAVFELARHYGREALKTGQIARAQAIPVRFLEAILNRLRQAGFLESRRGPEGGYTLAVAPWQISVGDVIRSIEGPMVPMRCVAGSLGRGCPLLGGCVFRSVWDRAQKALAQVYDGTTFQDLLDEEARVGADCDSCAVSYVI